MKVAVSLGTRPEIIKMAPVIKELKRNGENFFILHTGQHYSYNMDRVFFEQLQLPQPEYNLAVGSCYDGEQTAKILAGVEKVLKAEMPDIVLVEGDTNSVFATALAATKLHIKVGHVEAGLRSYDRQMPEEINRILTDHCSDYLFAPTDKSKGILLHEGIADSHVFVTGNTIVDAVYQYSPVARERSDILDTLHLSPKGYFLATIHRQENVDNADRFRLILGALRLITEEFSLPVIYPVHPRSRKMMGELHLESAGLRLIEPLDFFDFLELESHARLILTDSGGVQEESCILKVPCVTLRDNTERPETLEVGSNILAGVIPERVLECCRMMLGRENTWENPFGDGKAGEKIVRIITREESKDKIS